MATNDPQWLKNLSRRFQFLAVPHIAILLVTLQIFGFLLVLSDPVWFERLILLPERVTNGEVWRLVTFLAIPLTSSPIWMVFALLFLNSVLSSIESEWGAFKTTLYVLTSILVTVSFSFIFRYPVIQVTDFTSTLFLAAAALFPEYEMRVYFLFPVKMKYLGWLALAFVGLRLLQGSWIDRFFILAIYSNYLLFFGPSAFSQFRNWKRRREYRKNFR
ncbi:MAG: hypothetical protein H7301_12320 [Cryobacterium sp.]|nr:hypothetical protein [Oligoflexia bacterium]